MNRKGIVFDIKHCAMHDGPGLRTTVFLKGCSLHCWWCHNPECLEPHPQKIQKERKIGAKVFSETEVVGKYMSVDEVWTEIQKDTIFYEESGGGVTISGGEPLNQPDFLKELLTVAKMNGIHTAVDTSGFSSRQNFELIMPFTDLFLFDIKHVDDNQHIKYTGVSNCIIRQNFEMLLKHNKKVIVRYPLIPDINDSPECIEQLVDYLTETKEKVTEVHLLPYHDIARHKYNGLGMINKMNGTKKHTENQLNSFCEPFISKNLNVKIRG